MPKWLPVLALGAGALVVGTAVVLLVRSPAPSWTGPLVAGLAGLAAGSIREIWGSVTSMLTRRADRAGARIDKRHELSEARLGGRRLLTVANADRRELLGIHPAVSLPVGAADELDAELPTYVTRDVDADVRDALRAASRPGSPGGFFLLVGAAATGKTRCAYEAARACLSDWKLYIPRDAAELVEQIDSGVDFGRTVIWLDELHRFVVEGGLPVHALRKLSTAGEQPTIVLATIWPKHLDQLTRTPPEGIGDRGPSLKDQISRIFLLSDFSPREWDRARELALLDPRIAEAVEHRRSGTLTQTLASKQDLIRQLELPSDPYGGAVLRAAVDLRCTGHAEVLTRTTLEPVAAHCLEPGYRAVADPDTWFDTAVAWACRPVHEHTSASPLTPSASQIGRPDGWTVSDILVEHTLRSIADGSYRMAAEAWTAIMEHATVQHAYEIGVKASLNEDLDLAEWAFRHVMETADDDLSSLAARNLGIVLDHKNNTDEARAAYEHALQHGDAELAAQVAYILGNLLKNEGDLPGACAAYERAIASGLGSRAPEAACNLGVTLLDAGDTEGAVKAFRYAIDSRHPEAAPAAAYLYANMLETSDGPAAAEEAYRQVVPLRHETWSAQAAIWLGDRHTAHGENQRAQAAYRTAIDLGNAESTTKATTQLSALLRAEGDNRRADETEEFASRRADAEETILAILEQAAAANEHEDAERLRSLGRDALESGTLGHAPTAARKLGEAFEGYGQSNTAQEVYQHVVASGHQGAAPWAALALGNLLGKEHDEAGAEAAWRSALESGHLEAGSWAALNLGNLRSARHDEAGVDAAWNTVKEKDQPQVVAVLAKTLAEKGRSDQARAMWERVMASPAVEFAAEAATDLARHLSAQGDSVGEQAAYRRAIETGHAVYSPAAAYNLAMSLRRSGETDEARTWLEYAAASPLRVVASMARTELDTAQPGSGTE